MIQAKLKWYVLLYGGGEGQKIGWFMIIDFFIPNDAYPTGSYIQRHIFYGRSTFFIQQWNNTLLSWDPAQFGGIRQLNVEPTKLWIPDIILYNTWVNKIDIHLNILINVSTLLNQCKIACFNNARVYLIFVVIE